MVHRGELPKYKKKKQKQKQKQKKIKFSGGGEAGHICLTLIFGKISHRLTHDFKTTDEKNSKLD